jgi:hypothetical protein
MIICTRLRPPPQLFNIPLQKGDVPGGRRAVQRRLRIGTSLAVAVVWIMASTEMKKT